MWVHELRSLLSGYLRGVHRGVHLVGVSLAPAGLLTSGVQVPRAVLNVGLASSFQWGEGCFAGSFGCPRSQLEWQESGPCAVFNAARARTISCMGSDHVGV